MGKTSDATRKTNITPDRPSNDSVESDAIEASKFSGAKLFDRAVCDR